MTYPEALAANLNPEQMKQLGVVIPETVTSSGISFDELGLTPEQAASILIQENEEKYKAVSKAVDLSLDRVRLYRVYNPEPQGDEGNYYLQCMEMVVGGTNRAVTVKVAEGVDLADMDTDDKDIHTYKNGRKGERVLGASATLCMVNVISDVMSRPQMAVNHETGLVTQVSSVRYAKGTNLMQISVLDVA